MEVNYNDPLKFEDNNEQLSEQKEEEKDELKQKEVSIYDIENNTFTPRKVISVYMLLFFLNIGNNLDHGAIPVAIPVMKKDLNTNQ